MRELSLSILDLVQNSIRSGASLVEISVTNDGFGEKLTISVKDNGCGMDDAEVSKITDPFYTTCVTHKVGLGVPLFIQRSLLTGGGYEIKSQKGSGTAITAWFNTGSVDFVPLGDIASTLLCLVISAPNVDFIYTYKSNEYSFTLDTEKLFVELGVESDLSSTVKATLMKEYLADKIIQ